MNRFDGRIILVTGGSRGIGLACARRFAAQGGRVAIAARGRAGIDAARSSLPRAAGYIADVSDERQAADLAARVAADLGPIDILVNSAGAAKRSPPDELTPAKWRAAMDAKFFSTINVVDPVVKAMAARGEGTIVTIIGAGGKVANPAHLAGGSANAALMLATAGLGNAYAARGVRVLGVNPGLTETGRVEQGMRADARLAGISVADMIARSIASIPMGRMAAPEEVADMVLFLASDQARYVTGTVITMDGGQYPVVI